jgi:hypothetical protein
MQYHPRLKKAMAQIEQILQENDIAGMVVLHLPGHVEYRLRTDPTYSVAKWNGDELRVRARLLEDYKGDRAAWQRDVTNTINMLHMLAEVGGHISVQLFELSESIGRQVKAEHRNGDSSSNIQQNN